MSGQGKTQEQKRLIGEQLWLHYYNRALFERGLITEDERDRMAARINARSPWAGGRNCHGASC